MLRPLNHDQFVTMLTNFYRGLKGEHGVAWLWLEGCVVWHGCGLKGAWCGMTQG